MAQFLGNVPASHPRPMYLNRYPVSDEILKSAGQNGIVHSWSLLVKLFSTLFVQLAVCGFFHSPTSDVAGSVLNTLVMAERKRPKITNDWDEERKKSGILYLVSAAIAAFVVILVIVTLLREH
jgi:hypothetical protein